MIGLLFPFIGIKLFEPPGGDRIFFSDFVPMRIIQFGHFQMIAIDGIKNKFIVGNLYDFVWFVVMIQSVIFWKIIKNGSNSLTSIQFLLVFFDNWTWYPKNHAIGTPGHNRAIVLKWISFWSSVKRIEKRMWMVLSGFTHWIPFCQIQILCNPCLPFVRTLISSKISKTVSYIAIWELIRSISSWLIDFYCLNS